MAATNGSEFAQQDFKQSGMRQGADWEGSLWGVKPESCALSAGDKNGPDGPGRKGFMATGPGCGCCVSCFAQSMARGRVGRA